MPNPLAPALMTPTERRAELCRLLALGLVRLRLRQSSELSADTGESSLHSSTVQGAAIRIPLDGGEFLPHVSDGLEPPERVSVLHGLGSRRFEVPRARHGHTLANRYDTSAVTWVSPVDVNPG